MRMRTWAVLGLSMTTLIVAAQGCSPTATDSEPAAVGTRCTPGNNVFCRCADRTPGTKQCRLDGVSFEPCVTSRNGECAGGEDLTDPNSGRPLPPLGQPDAGTDGTVTSPISECPGRPVAVGSTEVVIEGDTTGAIDHGKGQSPGACAVGGGAPDHIYHVQPTGSGSLKIKVQGLGAFNPTIYLRSTCDDAASQIACGETTGPGGAEQVQRNVLTGRDYYLYVDGASGTAGKYAVSLKLTPGSFCGDGEVDVNEACDDLNNTDGDGCSAGCTSVTGNPEPAGGQCPGQPVHVWPGKVVTGAGSTIPFGNTFSKTGTSCSVSNNDLNAAPDHLYAVTAHAAGSLKVTLTPTESTFNPMLVARRTCEDPSTQATDMCANDAPSGERETMTFAVGNNETVYVAADGVIKDKGDYSISFELR